MCKTIVQQNHSHPIPLNSNFHSVLVLQSVQIPCVLAGSDTRCVTTEVNQTMTLKSSGKNHLGSGEVSSSSLK